MRAIQSDPATTKISSFSGSVRDAGIPKSPRYQLDKGGGIMSKIRGSVSGRSGGDANGQWLILRGSSVQ
jgi:hypothetical protein